MTLILSYFITCKISQASYKWKGWYQGLTVFLKWTGWHWIFFQTWILTNQILCPPGSWMSCSAVKNSHHPRQILIASTHINRTFVNYLSSKKYTLHCNVRYILHRLLVKVIFPRVFTFSVMLLYAFRLSSHPRTLGIILRPIFAMTCHSYKMLAVIQDILCQPVHS